MEHVHVAAGIIYRDGTVLACRRAGEGREMAGSWELPGGKVEKGEAPVAALRREIAEELGCHLRAAWPYDTVEHDYPKFHLTMEVFVGTLADGEEPVAHEGVHDQLRWLTRDELLDVAWLPADEDLARALGLYWDVAFEAEHL